MVDGRESMIRKRPGHQQDGQYGDDDGIDKSGRKKSPGPYGGSSGSDQPKPMVSNTFLAAFVTFFIAAGFIKHHYNASRARDPFRLSPSQKQNIQRKEQERVQAGNSKGGSVLNPTSLLTDEEDIALERDSEGRRYHLVFSTDCSPFQHWQSYLVYYTAMKVKQPGHVTRIASGCNEKEAQAMKDWFEKDIQFLSRRRFHLQLTPNFSEVKNDKGEVVGDYKFFNKPHGTRYWLENSPQIGYDQTTGAFPKDVQDNIVILIDPDMGLLRPITADFSNEHETVISPRRKQQGLVTKVVGPGKPAAQVYGFGIQWQKLDLAKVTGDPNSPAIKVSPDDGRLYYPVGPPYIATVVDMHKISSKWSEFVPRSYQEHPHLLAEMFAYCIAAAHLELPHQLIDSLMISDVTAAGEGWPLIDQIPAEDVCAFALDSPDHNKYALPNVVHLCQRYAMGNEWFFGKRRIPADVMYDCSAPLFEEPPHDLATKYNFKVPPKGHKTELSQTQAIRESFMICYLYGLVNEAATFYKQNACLPGSINLSKTRNLAKEMNAAEQIVL